MFPIASVASSSRTTARPAQDFPRFRVEPLFSAYVREETTCDSLPPEIDKIEQSYKTMAKRLNQGDIHLAFAGKSLNILENVYGPLLSNHVAPKVLSDYAELQIQTWSRLREEAVKEHVPKPSGKFPFRDISGKRFTLKGYGEPSFFSKPENEVYFSQVKPYISNGSNEEEIVKRYEKILSCRKIQQGDVPLQESSLIRQFGVFAKTKIKRRKCLGLYGGTLLTIDEKKFGKMPYMINVLPPEPEGYEYAFVDGDAILSRINTTFLYDASGNPFEQDPDGYNVHLDYFRTRISHDSKPEKDFMLPVVFATKDIPEGKELRLNYGFTPEDCQRTVL